MCGITGISYKNGEVNKQKLLRATDSLKHRGPDDSGYFISQDSKTGLGHRRLSFIDLGKNGIQPITTSDGRFTVTFNGEIYNYLFIKQQLQSLGYKFLTNTDTEVLLHGYAEWKQELPKHLEGMFAFVIYDSAENQLFLCRDRFGIKPLYYHLSDSLLIFGSEIKAILQYEEINKKVRAESVSLFLANRYVPTPYTIWENIFKIKPAHSLTVNLNHFTSQSNCYWKLKPGNEKKSFDDSYTEFHQLFKEAVDHHLVSDVPIGSFLSGGYDSSALVCLMQKELKYPTLTFSIGFEDWNESEHTYASIVAQAVNAELKTAIPEKIDLLTVQNLMWHYDDPIADISIIPTFEVSKLAATHRKAVVSGEGADEAMGGYWWHKPENFVWKNSFSKWISSFLKQSFNHTKYHYIQAMSMGLFDKKELNDALTGEYKKAIPNDPYAHFDGFKLNNTSTLKQLQYLDLNNFMSELILTKVDRASMANSLEVRVPFLQHNLIEFLFSLDESCYTRKNVQKPLLKEFLKSFVPEKILQRKKQGFVGPDKYYMDIEMYALHLTDGKLVKEKVINKNYIEKLIQQKDHWKLWKLFVLQCWWNNWVN